MTTNLFEVPAGLITADLCLAPLTNGSEASKRFKATKSVKKTVLGPLGSAAEGMAPRPTREFKLCEITTKKRITYAWCDAVTGTFYRVRDGKCWTSKNLRLA
jgi:hypothetical protein